MDSSKIDEELTFLPELEDHHREPLGHSDQQPHKAFHPALVEASEDLQNCTHQHTKNITYWYDVQDLHCKHWTNTNLNTENKTMVQSVTPLNYNQSLKTNNNLNKKSIMHIVKSVKATSNLLFMRRWYRSFCRPTPIAPDVTIITSVPPAINSFTYNMLYEASGQNLTWKTHGLKKKTTNVQNLGWNILPFCLIAFPYTFFYNFNPSTNSFQIVWKVQPAF